MLPSLTKARLSPLLLKRIVSSGIELQFSLHNTHDYNTYKMEDLIFNLFIFVLASFVGFELISKVPPTLHTPLMSGANAISGITLIGALIISGATGSVFSQWIGFAAIVFATINVVGGFMVTDRMLEMFKKKEDEE